MLNTMELNRPGEVLVNPDMDMFVISNVNPDKIVCPSNYLGLEMCYLRTFTCSKINVMRFSDNTMTIFIKPFRVKSNTQMKGSDKKKLKEKVTQDRRDVNSKRNLHEAELNMIDYQKDWQLKMVDV